MSNLLIGLLSNALLIIPFAGLITLCMVVWRPKAVVRHVLWLLLLIKLLTPPLVPIDFEEAWSRWEATAVTTASGTSSTQVPATTEENSITIDASLFPSSSMHIAESALAEDEVNWFTSSTAKHEVEGQEAMTSLPLPEPDAISAVSEVTSQSGWISEVMSAHATWLWFGLLGIWLSGSLIFFSMVVLRGYRFHRLLRHASMAESRWQQLAQTRAKSMGMKNAPLVKVLPGPLSPMVWSLSGPVTLLMPSRLLKEFSEVEIDTLLAHELAHVRRGDHWLRFIEILVLGIYWWHPVVWFARQQLREAEEQCCDAWVAHTMPHAKACYAQAILRTLDVLTIPPRSLPLGGSGLSPFRQLQRRLQMLKHPASAPSMTRRNRWALLTLGLIFLPLGLTWAQDDPPPPPPPPDQEGPPKVHKSDEPPHPPTDAPRRREPRGQATIPTSQLPMGDPFEVSKEEILFEARSEIRLSEVRLRGREIRNREIQSQLKLALSDFEQANKLHEAGKLSRTELDHARQRMEQLRSQMAMAEVEMEEARVQIEIARERLQLIEKGVIKPRRMMPPMMMGQGMGGFGALGMGRGDPTAGGGPGGPGMVGPSRSRRPGDDDPRPIPPSGGADAPRPGGGDAVPPGPGFGGARGRMGPGGPGGPGGPFGGGAGPGRGQPPSNMEELDQRIKDVERQLQELIQLRERLKKEKDRE